MARVASKFEVDNLSYMAWEKCSGWNQMENWYSSKLTLMPMFSLQVDIDINKYKELASPCHYMPEMNSANNNKFICPVGEHSLL